MSVAIRRYAAADRDRALAICLAAFAPIHDGFRAALGETAFALQYGDWREGYARSFDAIDPAADDATVIVAEVDGLVAGFAFLIYDAARRTGEIGLTAVDPSLRRRGVGRALMAHALDVFRARGATLACVGTGGDAAHAPARALYAAAGFDRAIPSVHLFRSL